MSTAYLAHPDFQDDLAEELARGRIEVDRWHDRLAITRASALPSVWAANIWHDVEEVEIGSIGSAATTLMARQRNWAMFAPQHRGRAKLIADRLSLSEDTVKGHVKNILSKLSASDRTHAVTIGLKRGIIAL